MIKSEIKALRKSMGLNTKAFGELIGVSPRTVESWESGRYEPSKPALKLIEKLDKRRK